MHDEEIKKNCECRGSFFDSYIGVYVIIGERESNMPIVLLESQLWRVCAGIIYLQEKEVADKMARGRKNLYETCVLPRLEEIKQWIKNGVSQEQAAKNLGIAYSTFNKYKSEFPEFSEAIINARVSVVQELRSALVKKACGYEYDEKKKVTTVIDFPKTTKKVLEEAGVDVEKLEKPKLVRTEVTTKRVPEDVTAINLALKNFDREDWSNDWKMQELKEEELKLKKKKVESESW